MLHTRSPRQLLDQFGEGRVPVDVLKIARGLGVQVQANPATAVLELALPQSGGPRVDYNPQEKPVRLRFAIAHALGHVCLEHFQRGARHIESVANYSSKTDQELEREANNFASRLLVPDSVLRYAVLHKGLTTVDKLADAFGVSQVLMCARIQQVDLT